MKGVEAQAGGGLEMRGSKERRKIRKTGDVFCLYPISSLEDNKVINKNIIDIFHLALAMNGIFEKLLQINRIDFS